MCSGRSMEAVLCRASLTFHAMPFRAVAGARARSAGSLRLVRGAASELVSEESARDFLSLVPHADYVDVSGAAHMVAGDRNDAFSNAVLEFLKRL